MDYSIDLSSGKVLIVDDVNTNRDILEQTLELDGYNISQASNGEMALEIALRSCPDLVLLDITMPQGIDGFETCRRLKADEATRNIPVIFISAREDMDSIIQGFRVGGVDYISKPFEEQEVRARIKTHLSLKLAKETLENQNDILEEKVKERTKELYETRLEIIHRLGRASEYRDIPGFHVIRVSRYSAILGHAAGMNNTELELLIHCTPVHDVGKVGIPDRILLKPGKLDPEEWKAMQKHVNIGAELLSGGHSEIMKMARTIALTHHERWDGTGYMEGLKGEEIPLEGRICSLCDAFDALTADRPYRKAYSVEDAIEKIESLSGKHFEPNLVKLFKELLPDIKKIKEQFPN